MSMPLRVGRHWLQPTVGFDAFWHFAAERQAIFWQRMADTPPPWTDDPVLRRFRFTNPYRATDRVSQFLISMVLYPRPQLPFDERDVVARTLLFRLFNRIDTWNAIEASLGAVDAETVLNGSVDRILDERFATGERLYSSAYIMPNPAFGHRTKHRNHLDLIRYCLAPDTLHRALHSVSLDELYRQLRSLPSIGAFLGFQLAIDLNYSTLFDFSEMDTVVAGPGAREGLQKCFTNPTLATAEAVIEAICAQADNQFAERGLRFQNLWGRPLQLIDVQNLFCETAKYTRVAHPELGGRRQRIKRNFTMNPAPLPLRFPPKWGLSPQALTPH